MRNVRLFAIGDLHLSLGAPDKAMDVFRGWENHQVQIEKNWRELVSDEDTVVLAGDLSWAMKLEDALPDFQFVDALPGKKILLKGNHDYWWNSKTKMDAFFEQNSLSSLQILHNNCYAFGDYGICGTRGWVHMEQEAPENAKMIAREAQRLSVSIEAAVSQQLEPIVFLHYPPLFAAAVNEEILEVLRHYRIQRCYYGHLHGPSHRLAVTGWKEGIWFQLISSDFLQFRPYLVE